MKRITEHIRQHLTEAAPTLDSISYQALRISEWCPEFEQLMRNRLIIGALRYAPMKAPRQPGHTDRLITMIRERLGDYHVAGNTEMLVDIANLCMVEFVHSDHPTKHFKAIDRKE